MNNLNCGGAEKALISLLNSIDFNKYEVDLLLFKKEGIFMKQLSNKVKLIDEPINYKYFDMPIKKACLELLRTKSINIMLERIKMGLLCKTEKNAAILEQKAWKHLARSMDSLEQQYDVAIGYLEKNPIYFCIDKVKAKQKIGWIHNDYDKLGMSKALDEPYYKKLDYIFTVSQECLNVLRNVFPQYKEKMRVMHNIVCKQVIERLASETIVEMDDKYINILSVGRLTYQKGFELAIQASKKLIEEGYPVKWYVIGEGNERCHLQKIIDQLNLTDRFILLGIKENPYPYIKKADLYVQPSRFEGKSIAIDEAKILCKPIVVTNFTTVKDQIQDGVDGLICEMSGESIADKIKQLIKNLELRNSLIMNLKKQEYKEELDVLYEVINL